MFAMDDIPLKTEFGLLLIHEPQNFKQTQLDVYLRRLLIFVDGEASVQQLMDKGLPQVDLDSIHRLAQLGLIARKQAVLSLPASRRVVDFASARFDILDLMLDLSMQDFAVRPWIDRFERVADLSILKQTLEQFLQSAVGQKHLHLQAQCYQLLGE